MAADRAETGFYCSTSGTYFSDKESLAEHYKSDFHRYNLKRKVAGLPPVTKEWFEARKTQLSSAAAAAPNQRMWYDPLTKRKFQTQNTYLAHVKSKKYQELVKASGQPAPAPIIMIKQTEDSSSNAAPAGAAATNGAAKPSAAGFTVKAPQRGSAPLPGAPAAAEQSEDEYEATDDESGWETASESDEEADTATAGVNSSNRGAPRKFKQQAAVEVEDEQAAEAAEQPEEDWEEWDVCVSLFDNKKSSSMQENLEYMYKSFGFYLPDAEYLTDPEGLLKYLGAKLQYGKVPLYTAGEDGNAKQFRSLHAVQRHMVDTNQCKMVYDGNEEEYEDFYDYSAAAAAEGEQSAESQGLALATALGGLSLGPGGGSSSSGGWELAVPGSSSSSGAGAVKAIGSRELAKYYRQKPKPLDTRQSVAANLVLAQYRSLGIETVDSKKQPEGVKRAQREKQRQQRQWLNLAMRTNVNNNLPNNVPY